MLWENPEKKQNSKNYYPTINISMSSWIFIFAPSHLLCYVPKIHSRLVLIATNSFTSYSPTIMRKMSFHLRMEVWAGLGLRGGKKILKVWEIWLKFVQAVPNLSLLESNPVTLPAETFFHFLMPAKYIIGIWVFPVSSVSATQHFNSVFIRISNLINLKYLSHKGKIKSYPF